MLLAYRELRKINTVLISNCIITLKKNLPKRLIRFNEKLYNARLGITVNTRKV